MLGNFSPSDWNFFALPLELFSGQVAVSTDSRRRRREARRAHQQLACGGNKRQGRQQLAALYICRASGIDSPPTPTLAGLRHWSPRCPFPTSSRFHRLPESRGAGLHLTTGAVERSAPRPLSPCAPVSSTRPTRPAATASNGSTRLREVPLVPLCPLARLPIRFRQLWVPGTNGRPHGELRVRLRFRRRRSGASESFGPAPSPSPGPPPADYSAMPQGSRVRSFPHVEGNYPLHVYIPVLIPSDARK
uniref:U6 snRNA phosphodiesterase 1 n=1 Tax=Arundo donax TaxID=35708 RepID=A0A0A9BFK1_ARUDO